MVLLRSLVPSFLTTLNLLRLSNINLPLKYAVCHSPYVIFTTERGNEMPYVIFSTSSGKIFRMN